MKALVPLLLVLLAACNMPTYANLGAPSKTLTAQGLKFKIIYTATEAEAYRLTPMLKPRYDLVRAAGIEAIETATTCRVNPSRVTGDPAKLTAELIC